MWNELAHSGVIAVDVGFEEFGEEAALGFGRGSEVGSGTVFLVVFFVRDGGATGYSSFQLVADGFFFCFEGFGESIQERIHGCVERYVVEDGENEEYDHEDHLGPCFTNGEEPD